MSLNLLKQTVYFSLFVQLITGIITIFSILYKVPIEHIILKDINILELIVQGIEFIFYIYISLAVIQTRNIATLRYFDWFITTPTMLISLLSYFKYETSLAKLKSQNADQKDLEEVMKDVRIINILKSETKIITYIIIANALMLLFGLFGELGYINIIVSNIIGFIFFGIVFYIIYTYAKDNKETMKLYMFFFTVWSLYGLFHLLPHIQKNIGYNLLDIVAKNFFGLFIFYKLRQVKL